MGMCVCMWVHNFFLNFEPLEISQTFIVSVLLPKFLCWHFISFPGGAGGKEPALIPGWGRPPGGGCANPLQFSCLENPMDRSTWRATAHRVIMGWTWLKRFSTRTRFIKGYENIQSFKEIEQANFLHVYLIFSKWKLLNIHRRKENNILNLCVCVYVLSCVWLFCNSMDYSPQGFSVYGISQARILEWVATSFSGGSSWPRNQTHISCIGRGILSFWAPREDHNELLPKTQRDRVEREVGGDGEYM